MIACPNKCLLIQSGTPFLWLIFCFCLKSLTYFIFLDTNEMQNEFKAKNIFIVRLACLTNLQRV